MRNAFAHEITQLAQQDERIVLLSGDIGNRLFDEFKAKCPGRFHNCGVAEANMIGVAAGLALNGLRPICYTIAPFITYRCMEQIRVDVCYHHLPVTIVGTGAGLAYASLGSTHHSCEDIGMLRVLPGLVVMAPADAHEVRGCLRAVLHQPQPAYIRIGKKGEPLIHASTPEITVGKALVLTLPGKVTLLSTGNMLPAAQATAALLAAQNISCGVVSLPTVKPLDTALLQQVFAASQVVATLEEHSILGGLGGSVAEWLSEQSAPCARLLRFGTADEFYHETGEQEHAHEHFGLVPERMSARVLAALTRP
jgi:transketolase